MTNSTGVGCPQCGSSLETSGRLCEHQRKILDERLPLLTPSRVGLVHELWLYLADGRRVDQVLVDVITRSDIGADEAVAAMWDLIDSGRLTYGTDARVNRRCTQWELAPNQEVVQCEFPNTHAGKHAAGSTTWSFSKCRAVWERIGGEQRVCELWQGHEGVHRARIAYAEGWATWTTG